MTPPLRFDHEADIVIVGGGSAGCVLANRLTQDATLRVLLIEAGGEARSPLIALPVGYAKIVTDPRFDWNYHPLPDPSINGRSWIWSAGRVLGGGSSINGQVFIRGTRGDFDRWAAAGATGWSFDEIFPYFLRSEDWQGAQNAAHGRGGPLAVSPMRDPHPLSLRFLQACREYGLPTLAEYNDGANQGAFLTQANQLNGLRCSTEKAFLRPARKRPNLQVLTGATVRRILFDGCRACGVEFEQADRVATAAALRETIVSAGAIGSPALLMRSGIGPAMHLRDRGVAVVHDAVDVGSNLQEHPAVGISRFVSVPTLNTRMGPFDMLRHAARFASSRMGPLTTPAVQAMGLARSMPGLPEPDLQLHFSPLAGTIGADAVSPAKAVLAKEAAVTCYASLCQPRGRGRVSLAGDGTPAIEHQLVGHEEDMATLVRGMRLVSGIFAEPAFRSIMTGPRVPAEPPTDDAGWIDHVRRNAVITWHPVGTCRMGSDADAVLDPQLRVRGVQALRVADASVMPTITSGNTNAPTIMIGEKAADLIAEDL